MVVTEEPAKVPGRDKFDLDEFGVCIYSTSGQMLKFGSVKSKHTLQSVVSVISFLIA